MSAEAYQAWIPDYQAVVEKIYNEDKVFIKSFVYHGKSGVPHILFFNSERNPKYKGETVGVQEWQNTMKKLVKSFCAKKVVKRLVRYTSL